VNAADVTKIPTDTLDEMRARVDAATPGPWTTYRHAYGVGIETGDPDDGIQLFIETWGLTYPEHEEDAEFIAHAREDMPRLLDALDAAEAEVERLRDQLQRERAEERARCVALIRQKFGVTNRAADWLARQEITRD